MNATLASAPGPLIGLALSGGGFRATLFGLGALCRLNELRYLKRIDRISSVSGGSITAGYLGFRWNDLHFDGNGIATNFDSVVVQPLRKFCTLSVDAPAVISGVLTPFRTIGDKIAAKYDKELFRKADGSSATLQDLPSDGEGPRFVLCATNLQTRANVRLSKPYIADFNLGRLKNPTTKLSVAVGASSAFPPVLSPVILETDPDQWIDPPVNPPAHLRELRKKLVLTDGGVYDNIGLEPIWNKESRDPSKLFGTILVADAGAPADIDEAPRRDWLGQLTRVRGIMMEQTRALRRRMIMQELVAKRLNGTLWRIGTRIDEYQLADAMISDTPATAALQNVRTRLNSFDEREQSELINWGYALCDAAMRKHVAPGSRPTAWPAPGPYAFPIRPFP
jgi:NTE family protein